MAGFEHNQLPFVVERRNPGKNIYRQFDYVQQHLEPVWHCALAVVRFPFASPHAQTKSGWMESQRVGVGQRTAQKSVVRNEGIF